jgi:molybdopterin synthase sulfur carrier subunit
MVDEDGWGEKEREGAAMEIRLYATLRDIAGQRTVDLRTERAQTVGDALCALVRAYPALRPHIFDEQDQLVGYVAVMLEGRNVRFLDGLTTPLAGAAHLDVFPPVGGGAATASWRRLH